MRGVLQTVDQPVRPGPSRWRRRWAIWLFSLIAVVALVAFAYHEWTRPRPIPPVEIYRGVVYSCFEGNSPECSGLVHVARVDLSAPGIQLYLTPLDPAAVAQGYQYRLDTAAHVVERENLAVVVNGAFFLSKSGLLQWSGDWARGVQTIIAGGQVSHIDPNSYLLWFESDLTPHLEFEKPPPASALSRARWAIGGGAIPLWKGQLRESAAGHTMDRRTAVGIDTDRKLLWLVAFESASSLAAARVLAEQGAQEGFLLDGGHSTAMVLGSKARNLQTRAPLPGRRPVATFFGVRAGPLN
jgi:hypothetical protein